MRFDSPSPGCLLVEGASDLSGRRCCLPGVVRGLEGIKNVMLFPVFLILVSRFIIHALSEQGASAVPRPEPLLPIRIGGPKNVPGMP